MIYQKQNVTCPICKSVECIHEYDYLTLSEKIECSNCKYSICFTYITDVKGNTIKLDNNKYLILENLISKGFLMKNPFGILINQYVNGKIIGNAIKSELHQYNTLLKSSKSGEQRYNLSKTTIYRYLDNKITVDVIFKNYNDHGDELPF